MVGKDKISLDGQLPPVSWRGVLRPTVMALVVTPVKEVLLVQPKFAALNGWIFPQGAIERDESPRQAMLRELQVELHWNADLFDCSTIRLLLVAPAPATKKIFCVVGLQMRRWIAPSLDVENEKWCTSGGPNELWGRVTGCSATKRQLMKRTIQVAIAVDLLHSARWTPDRSVDFTKHA